MRLNRLVALVIALLALAVTSDVAFAADTVYRNPTYGFTVTYPTEFQQVTGPDGGLFNTDLTLDRGMIDVSFIADTRFYQGMDSVTGAGVAVGEIVPLPQFGCTTVGMGETTIDGNHFYHGVGASREGSQLGKVTFYLVQHGNVCLKIIEKIVIDESSATPLTDEQRKQLTDGLERIALSLSFK